MKTTYMISYLNSKEEITHFDYRGFNSYLEASEALIEQDHTVFPEFDVHGEEGNYEYTQLLFEYYDKNDGDPIHWFAKIEELEMQ